MTFSVSLNGIDGSNPLGFLAAIGTLRTASLTIATDIRMHWQLVSGAWRPVLTNLPEMFDNERFIREILAFLAEPDQLPLLEEIGPDLTITGQRMRVISLDLLSQLTSGPTDFSRARIQVDFLAAFGCDACTAENDAKSLIEDTALRTMSGAGHQHFIKFMRDIIAATESVHLRKTLFEDWQYDDSGRGLNLRWDPADDRRYALRWYNPSNDANMTMRGANRLAIEALPIFATAPVNGKLQTAGFVQRRRQGVRWTWPIWDTPIDLDTTRGILQSSLVTAPSETIDGVSYQAWREKLSRLGITAVFQSRRITTGKFRNFTPSEPL